MPDPGALVLTEYEPWLLGWCRWTLDQIHEAREMANGGRVEIRTTLASGSWRWRGKGAPYREYVSRRASRATLQVDRVGGPRCGPPTMPPRESEDSGRSAIPPAHRDG